MGVAKNLFLFFLAMYQVFISLRFAESENEANALKNALEEKGISTFLCAVLPGGDIRREIVNALSSCQLAIIMGTKTYGRETSVGYSTFDELRFIHEERKPFFLVKMCERFEEAETRFLLGSSVCFIQWFPGSQMPGDLIAKIIEKLASTTVSVDPEQKENPGVLSQLDNAPKSNVGGFDPRHGIPVIRTAKYDVYKCQGINFSSGGRAFNDPLICSTANADTDAITVFKTYPDCTHIVLWGGKLHYLNGDKIPDAILVPGDPNCVTYAKVSHGLKYNEFEPEGLAMTSAIRILCPTKPGLSRVKSNVEGLFDPITAGICVHRTEKYEVYKCESTDFSPGGRAFNNPLDSVTDNADTDAITVFKNYPECTHVVLWGGKLHYLKGDKIPDAKLVAKPNCVTYAKVLLG
jgi:hypothetical protein